MESEKNTNLTSLDRENIRGFVVSLMAIPAALIAIIAFSAGFFFQEVFGGKAYRDAYKDAFKESIQSISDANINAELAANNAESSKAALEDIQRRAAKASETTNRLSQLLDDAATLEQVAKLVTADVLAATTTSRELVAPFFPAGSLVFNARLKACPAGFKSVGSIALDAHDKSELAKIFRDEIIPAVGRNIKDGGWSKPDHDSFRFYACMKDSS